MMLIGCFMLVSRLEYSSTLRLEVKYSSESSVRFQRNTQLYIPQDRTLQTPKCSTPKSKREKSSEYPAGNRTLTDWVAATRTRLCCMSLQLQVLRVNCSFAPLQKIFRSAVMMRQLLRHVREAGSLNKVLQAVPFPATLLAMEAQASIDRP
jgi:hypothetical protein